LTSPDTRVVEAGAAPEADGQPAPTAGEPVAQAPRRVPPVAPLPEPERSLPEAAARLMPHEIPRAEIARVLERARALRRRMDDAP
jgi:hypothetical protein